MAISISTGRIKADFRRAAGAALMEELEAVLRESQPLVPVDTGDLKNSGHTDGPVERGSSVMGTIGYDTPYALIQHEDLSFNHPNGGQAKYLEQPFNERAGSMAERVGRGIAQRMGLR